MIAIDTRPGLNRMVKAVQLLAHRRLKISEIMYRLGVSQRTAYRVLERLEEFGYSVEVDFDGRYFITNNVCPLCGCKTNKHYE